MSHREYNLSGNWRKMVPESSGTRSSDSSHEADPYRLSDSSRGHQIQDYGLRLQSTDSASTGAHPSQTFFRHDSQDVPPTGREEKLCKGDVDASPCCCSSGEVTRRSSPACNAVWRKVLYERQPFEDNYVDPLLFLKDLRKNANVTRYQYGDVVQDTFVIAQQISLLVLYVYVWAMIYTDALSAESLLKVNVVGVALTAIAYMSGAQHLTAENSTSAWFAGQQLLSILRQVFTLGMILVLLSPVLQTLTVTYTDDTIVALTILTMTVHLVGTDYHYLNGYSTKYQQNLAVNMATFAIILTASRIRSPTLSGGLIAFGTLCFSLSPVARHILKQTSNVAHVALTFSLVGLAIGCLLPFPVLVSLFVLVIVLVSIVIPWFFVTLHSWKKQINGPWDEAKLTNSAAAAEWASLGQD